MNTAQQLVSLPGVSRCRMAGYQRLIPDKLMSEIPQLPVKSSLKIKFIRCGRAWVTKPASIDGN